MSHFYFIYYPTRFWGWPPKLRRISEIDREHARRKKNMYRPKKGHIFALFRIFSTEEREDRKKREYWSKLAQP